MFALTLVHVPSLGCECGGPNDIKYEILAFAKYDTYFCACLYLLHVRQQKTHICARSFINAFFISETFAKPLLYAKSSSINNQQCETGELTTKPQANKHFLFRIKKMLLKNLKISST